MIQSGSGLRLALKTRQRLRIFGNRIGQKLQGDKSSKREVFGFVDDTHPAAAQLLDNAIVGDRLADHWRGIL